ncbi:MAG: hypothetical protein WKG07_46915 [Hymenobacter sp.]
MPRALLQLPPPLATGEAHLAAIVYEQAEADPNDQSRIPDDDDDTDEDDDNLSLIGPGADLPRFFLLEATLGRSPDEAGTPTMLGELRGEHHHHHHSGPRRPARYHRPLPASPRRLYWAPSPTTYLSCASCGSRGVR